MKSALVLLVFSFAMQGCSVYLAATAPGPVAVEEVKVGSTRAEAVAVFGMPVQSTVHQGISTDVFEFIDGNPSASKLRILLYIAGDLLTVYLTELVFWPMELEMFQGTEGRAVVKYGPDDVVQSVHVTRRDGSPWKQEPKEEVPRKARE